MLQHKLHGPMTQPAMSIVKKIFPGRRVWHHQKSIARAYSSPIRRAAITALLRFTTGKSHLRKRLPVRACHGIRNSLSLFCSPNSAGAQIQAA
jgi:hypothetical protein